MIDGNKCRFDESLYNAINDQIQEWAPDTDPPSSNDGIRRKAFGSWFDGWDAATEVAAIIAQRCMTALNDEELGKMAYIAACTAYENLDPPDWDQLQEIDPHAQEAHIAAARAVRDALGGIDQ